MPVLKGGNCIEFSLILTNIYCYCTIKLCNKSKRSIYFSTLDKYFWFYWIKFFATKHISDHIIKYNQYLAFFVWIVFINIFLNYIAIIQVFNKSFRIVSTGTQREWTSIRRGYYVDTSKTIFWRISTSFRWTSLIEKSTLFPRTFFNVISMVEICTMFLLTIFDVILMGKNSASFLVSCKLMKTFGEVFSCVCNFKQVIFARLLSLKFSSKSSWCSPVPLKF